MTAAPFDRDSLRRALEGAGPGVALERTTLDSLFSEFRVPFLAFFNARLARDSARQQGDSAALSRADARYEKAQAELDAARARLTPKIDSLRQVIRLWEDTTYARFPVLADSLRDASGHALISDTTDANGVVSLHLPKSEAGWWITASSWNVLDPNALWYWNAPVTGDSLVLDQRSGSLRARY